MTTRMKIMWPGIPTLLAALFMLTLSAVHPRQALADGECPNKGSIGCWASACVFTPEALFVNGVTKDGYRRAEYIIPEHGPIKYRTVKYFDSECSKPDENEISEWLDDSANFRRLDSKPIDDTLTVEQVAFGPIEHGGQGKVVVRGRFYVLEKNLLCMSSNLLYTEDGPGFDMRPSSDPAGAAMRRSCLHRLAELMTPPSVNIVGTVVPPYPQGFDSFEGTCIAGKGKTAQPCQYTIGILQASRDDTPVGIFAGTYDHLENNFIRWKVTDYIQYPAVPNGHTFTSVGCQLNGTEDETILAVLEPEKGNSMEPAGLGKAIWARKLNVASGKFTTVGTSSVKCLYEGMAEGRVGGH